MDIVTMQRPAIPIRTSIRQNVSPGTSSSTIATYQYTDTNELAGCWFPQQIEVSENIRYSRGISYGQDEDNLYDRAQDIKPQKGLFVEKPVTRTPERESRSDMGYQQVIFGDQTSITKHMINHYKVNRLQESSLMHSEPKEVVTNTNRG